MGKTPDSRRAISRPIFPAVKSDYRKKLVTLGEFINTTHDTWSGRRANGFVWPAVNAHLVAFSRRNLNYFPF